MADGDDPKNVKYTLQIPAALWQIFGERADDKGKTRSEELRQAMRVYHYLGTRIDEGSEIIVRGRDGREERVVIL